MPEAGKRALQERLESGPPLLLDGAIGTELERRGLQTGLPLWSTHALLAHPEQVEAIHRDYAAAGCEILTANTFRTQRRTLARAGLGERATELTRLAVDLARRAAADARASAWVAGSVPPLEDCYRPDLVPEQQAVEREQREHVRTLVEAGVDLLLLETHNSVREAVAALRAARESGLLAAVSLVCDPEARLLSGETLERAVAALAPLAPELVAVNCVPPSTVPACLPALRDANPPFGVYANLGAPDDATGFTRSEDCTPERYAQHVARWLTAGARLVGGCCGTTPQHLARAARARTGRERSARSG